MIIIEIILVIIELSIILAKATEKKCDPLADDLADLIFLHTSRSTK